MVYFALPLWFVITMIAISIADVVVTAVGVGMGLRHHDHLHPGTPRSYRAPD